jgi:hypothetical protein
MVSTGAASKNNLQYIQVDSTLTCLITAEGQFIGAIRVSDDPRPALGVCLDPNGSKVLDLRAADHKEHPAPVLWWLSRKPEKLRIVGQTTLIRTRGVPF